METKDNPGLIIYSTIAPYQPVPGDGIPEGTIVPAPQDSVVSEVDEIIRSDDRNIFDNKPKVERDHVHGDILIWFSSADSKVGAAEFLDHPELVDYITDVRVKALESGIAVSAPLHHYLR